MKRVKAHIIQSGAMGMNQLEDRAREGSELASPLDEAPQDAVLRPGTGSAAVFKPEVSSENPPASSSEGPKP